jgi:Uma2 family endonuclease
MPGDFLLRGPRLSMRQFHAFRDARPEEEKWELIDGVPFLPDRPTILHQRLGSRLEELLNRRLRSARPEWCAIFRASVWVKGDKKYNPWPDVTVTHTAIRPGQIYVQRFYFVAEVLSESDKKAVLEAKLRYYQDHEHNRCVLLVRQDRVGADQYGRSGGTWMHRALDKAQDDLAFPDIGRVGRLGDLYRFTPLDPFASLPRSP